MATAGTLALTTHMNFKPHPGRGAVVTMGYARLKSSGNIDAGDIGMKTINAMIFTLYRANNAPGHFGEGVFGSINGRGSLGNTCNFQHLWGSFKEQAAGTAHAGTRAAGTFQTSWIATGA